jgi:hypothetical protein
MQCDKQRMYYNSYDKWHTAHVAVQHTLALVLDSCVQSKDHIMRMCECTCVYVRMCICAWGVRLQGRFARVRWLDLHRLWL